MGEELVEQLGLGRDIEARRGLVEDEHAGPGLGGIQGPCEGDSLPLPAREVGAVGERSRQHRVPPGRQCLDDVGGSCRLGRSAGQGEGVGSVRVGQRDVLDRWELEVCEVLEDHAEFGSPLGEIQIGEVRAVDENPAGVGSVEPAEELQQCGLACSVRSDDGQRLSRLDDEIQPIEHRTFGAGVGEGDVVELDCRRARTVACQVGRTVGSALPDVEPGQRLDRCQLWHCRFDRERFETHRGEHPRHGDHAAQRCSEADRIEVALYAVASDQRERNQRGQRIQYEDRPVQALRAEEHLGQLGNGCTAMALEPFDGPWSEPVQPELLGTQWCPENLGPVRSSTTVSCRVDHPRCDRSRIVPTQDAPLPGDEDERRHRGEYRVAGYHRSRCQRPCEARQQPELTLCARSHVEQVRVLHRQRRSIAHGLRLEMIDPRAYRHRLSDGAAHRAVDTCRHPVPIRHQQRLRHLIQRQQHGHDGQRDTERRQRPGARRNDDPVDQPGHRHRSGCGQKRCHQHRRRQHDEHRAGHDTEKTEQSDSIPDELSCLGDHAFRRAWEATQRTLFTDRQSVNGIEKPARCGTLGEWSRGRSRLSRVEPRLSRSLAVCSSSRATPRRR